MATVLKNKTSFADIVRKLLLSWLLAAALEYFLLPSADKLLDSLDGLGKMSMSRVLVLTAIFTALIWLLSKYKNTVKAERIGIPLVFSILSITALIYNFSWSLLGFCTVIALIVLVYCFWGWDGTAVVPSTVKGESRGAIWCLVGLTAAFFLFVCVWTVSRICCYSTPTYDFGIFSQMFHHMRTTGIPNTTVERDGLLSHFAVHVSPIYYLLLPFYMLAPYPATLQVLQSAVLASAVIPLWLIGKQHGLPPYIRVLLCALLLLYPAYSGGASYDIHENCFLTPLILWLFYGLDKKNIWLTGIFGMLTLLVKEDAAVYVAVIALWKLLSSLLRKERWGTFAGSILLLCSVGWFFLVTNYLANHGDGVMNDRYSNFMYDGSKSLFTVIKSVLLCPMKLLYECSDTEKLKFIGLTVGPLLGIPFITRRYERLVLLIPYVLVNLMSDYQYQHDIFFQYTYGSAAFLFYLMLVNLSDIQSKPLRLVPVLCGVVTAGVLFACWNVPKAVSYPQAYFENRAHYNSITQMLDTVPEDASVTATTFYTTRLSRREVLYDVRYSSKEHLLSTQYVVLNPSESSSYKAYGSYEDLVKLLQKEGYILQNEIEGTLEIWKK